MPMFMRWQSYKYWLIWINIECVSIGKLDKLHSVLKATKTELLPLSRSLVCRIVLMHMQVKELLIKIH